MVGASELANLPRRPQSEMGTRITRRLLTLIAFILPCLIVLETLFSSNASLLRLPWSFGTIARKHKPVANRAGVGNQQAIANEKEKIPVRMTEMKMKNGANSTPSYRSTRRSARSLSRFVGIDVVKVRVQSSTTARRTTLERSTNAVRW